MVKYINKESCYIEDTVILKDNIVVYPNVTLLGNTIIGNNTIIYPNTTIENSEIGENNIIKSSNIIDSKIMNNNNIGPNSYIRNKSLIKNNCKVGFSTEVKNSKINDYTKLAHLTYVGDANVGSYVNFGAGVKIANYDGIKKYRINIGNNVFIGCNSVLVSPLNIGNNIMIAAGSVITKDISDDCLSIARTRQINKENYYSKKEI